MCNMQELYLQNNQISDTGMISFSDALGKGALASNATIYMQGNNVTETGKQVMRNAAEPRGLDVRF